MKKAAEIFLLSRFFMKNDVSYLKTPISRYTGLRR
jgi:hypothetical protein